MNTPNNKRKKESIERIEKVFISLLQTNELNEISVSDICKLAGLNRTTFYANYTDIYGLADSIRDKLEHNLSDLYRNEITRGFNSNDYLKLFCHIRITRYFIRPISNWGMTTAIRLFLTILTLHGSTLTIVLLNIIWNFLKAELQKSLKCGCKTAAKKARKICMKS